MKVQDGWKGGGSIFKCGLCVMKDVVKVRNENEKLKRDMEQMKKDDDNRKEAGVYENNENVKTWTTIAKRMPDGKNIEKYERVESGMIVNRSEIRNEVEERRFEEKRKRRLIVFNLGQSEVKLTESFVWDMIERVGVRIRSEDVAYTIRMRKKDGDETVKPVIIDFKGEYDKCMVLRNKAEYKDTEEYKSVLEQDLSREEREKGRDRIHEIKVEWMMRGGIIREGRLYKRHIHCESGVEECKEDSYKRETD